MKNNIQYRWFVLLIFVLSQIFLSIAGYGWGALAPFLKKLMLLNNTQVGGIGSTFFFAAALSALPFGILVDRYGVKNGLISWLGFTGIPLLLLAIFKPAFSVFILMVAISGLGYGVGNPVCSKGLFLWFDSNTRGLVFGIKQAAVTVGASLSGIVMVYFATQAGVFNSLGIVGSIIAVMIIVAIIYYRNPIQSEFVFNKKTVHGIGTSFSGVFELLTNKSFLYLSIISALLGMAQGVVAAFIILYANEKLGYTLLESGFILSLVMFSGTVGRILWGFISDRMYNARRKPILIIITALAVVTVVALSVCVSWYRWLLISVFVGLGLSTAGWNSIVLAWIAEITVKSKTATSIGLASTIGWLGLSSGPIAFGSIIDHYGFFYAWMSLAFFCTCSLIFCIFLPEAESS